MTDQTDTAATNPITRAFRAAKNWATRHPKATAIAVSAGLCGSLFAALPVGVALSLTPLIAIGVGPHIYAKLDGDDYYNVADGYFYGGITAALIGTLGVLSIAIVHAERSQSLAIIAATVCPGSGSIEVANIGLGGNSTISFKNEDGLTLVSETRDGEEIANKSARAAPNGDCLSLSSATILGGRKIVTPPGQRPAP